MKRFLVVLILLAAFTSAIAVAQAKPADPPLLTTLEPGGFRNIQQDLNINVVFVGFEEPDIDDTHFLDGLPETYRAINRFPAFYGLPALLGVTYNYDYNLVYSDAAFEDDFFSYLGSIATPNPLTLYQDEYNLQANRSLTIANNHWIDAPSVEQWLADNAGSSLNIDTSDYTVFFINWFGRPDFVHHVYTKTDEPDPDTGFNFGEALHSRKISGWGGTTPDDEESGLGSLHRIWFYDLSAGPEGWSENWRIDSSPGYTIPPSWEYGNTTGYRPFDDLSGDLAKVLRYVAIDLLFTTSPLYKPALSPPALPQDIELDINVYQIDPAADGTQFFDLGLLTSELSELQPYNNFSTEMNSIPFGPPFERVYLCFFNNVSCYGNRLFGDAFGDPFLFHNDHLLQYLEGDGDYEVPVFAYNTTDELFTCCLGYADDNWADGTQSFVFAFDAPFVRDGGYGFTTTSIHEVGHHLGLSHPHDGYDYEDDLDFGPVGPFLFAWLGDFSNSMMSYIDLNWDFSQFDRDNMNRWMTSVYINQANTILADIYASPRAAQVSGLLISADNAATAALDSYAAMDYATAVTQAQSAYQDVLEAARQINVKVEPQAWQADYKAKGKSDKFIDEVDYDSQRFKP
jgi:hypothetical protein